MRAVQGEPNIQQKRDLSTTRATVNRPGSEKSQPSMYNAFGGAHFATQIRTRANSKETGAAIHQSDTETRSNAKTQSDEPAKPKYQSSHGPNNQHDLSVPIRRMCAERALAKRRRTTAPYPYPDQGVSFDLVPMKLSGGYRGFDTGSLDPESAKMALRGRSAASFGIAPLLDPTIPGDTIRGHTGPSGPK